MINSNTAMDKMLWAYKEEPPGSICKGPFCEFFRNNLHKG